MMPIGDGIGEQVARGSKLWAMVPLCFVIGVFVTIAEPDLQVLAHQVPAVPDMVIILTVAAGVGIFLAVALLRSRFGWPLNKLLIGFYALVFLLAFLVPKEFLAVAFDSGGVTTGPITVPFIMAMGAGLTALRSHKDSEADSFGVVALCSIGPILAYDPGTVLQRPGLELYTLFHPGPGDHRRCGGLFCIWVPYLY